MVVIEIISLLYGWECLIIQNQASLQGKRDDQPKKTMTFAIVHMSVAFGVVYLMTGSLALGGAVALVEPLINTMAYFFHEKGLGSIHGQPAGNPVLIGCHFSTSQ